MSENNLRSRVRKAITKHPDKTYKEIAGMLSCSVSAVATYSAGRRRDSKTVPVADRPVMSSGDINEAFSVCPGRNGTASQIPLKQVVSMLGKGVGFGNRCSPDAPVRIERDENGTTYTLRYSAKSKTVEEFFKNFRYLIRVDDTSEDACGAPLSHCTTLKDLKNTMYGGIDDALSNTNSVHPPYDTFDWREPKDACSLWEGDPPTLDDFTEMVEPLKVAGTDTSREMLCMASIHGGEGPLKGLLLATDSYRVAYIRPPQPFAVTGVNIPAQTLRKFADMSRSAKQTGAPVEMSVGDIVTFDDRTNMAAAEAPQTTTMRCGNVAIQLSIKSDTHLGNPQDFPSFDRLYPDNLVDVFEVPNVGTITKWISSQNKNGMNNVAVLSPGVQGKQPTVEVKNLEGPVTFVVPDGEQGVTKTTEWASGPGNKIGFNSRYLAEAIQLTGKHSPASIALVGTSEERMSPLRPVIFSAKNKPPKNKTEVEVLLMPVRLE